MDNNPIEIIDIAPEYYDDFKRLNLEWISRYFKIEPHDLEQLGDPQKYILSDGGYVLLARAGADIIGTAALVNCGDGVFELAKMAVDDQWKGHQIGKKLGLAALERVRQAGGTEIFLESNRKLTPALNLYTKLGFVEVPLGETPYSRADIKMVLKL